MSLSDKIKQKTDQVIAKFAKPKPQPQPTHGTVTGFEQGLIQVSTSDGQQLRQQQGTRAIGLGQQVVAHDNTAVFTGEAGVLPKPGRVFIAAQTRKKFEDYYLFRYREYSPSDRALSENRRANVLAGDDIPIRSLSDGRILAYHPDQSSVTPVKDRLLLSNGKGLAVEVPGWATSVPRGGGYITPVPRVIIYQGKITVLYAYFAASTHLAKATTFDKSLRLVGQKTVTLSTTTPGVSGVSAARTTSSIVPEFDQKVYAKGLDWFPPVFMGGGLVLNQIYGSAPNVRVFPIGISLFDHYTLDKPFGPLGRQRPIFSGDIIDYERIREKTFAPGNFFIGGANLRPLDASTALATRVTRDLNYRGIDVDENDGEVARLAALVDAPDYSSDPELGPYFDNAGIWNTLQKP
jgi:hypothetical protein